MAKIVQLCYNICALLFFVCVSEGACVSECVRACVCVRVLSVSSPATNIAVSLNFIL